MNTRTIINSHIQISQGVLRYFSHKKKEELNGYVNVCDAIFVLSLLTGTVSEEKVSTFGTKLNYYDSKVEEELSETIEAPFGEAVRKIRSSLDDSYSELTSSDILAIRRYIKASIVRAPRNHDDPKVRSIAQCLGVTLTPSMSVDFLLSRLDELEPFPNTGMVLIKNTSPASFVIPFHPKFCFGLVPIGDFDKTPQGLDLATMVLNNPRDVEMINNLSIGTELANQQLIVGSDPKELERLYSFYQELLKNKAK